MIISNKKNSNSNNVIKKILQKINYLKKNHWYDMKTKNNK